MIKEYFVDNIVIATGILITPTNSELIDTNNIIDIDDNASTIIRSGPVSGGNSIDVIAEFPLDVGIPISMSVRYVGKYSRYITQTIWVYNFSTKNWVGLDSHIVSTSEVTINFNVNQPQNFAQNGICKVKITTSPSSVGFYAYLNQLIVSADIIEPEPEPEPEPLTLESLEKRVRKLELEVFGI